MARGGERRGVGFGDLMAAVLSLIWLGAVVWYFSAARGGEDGGAAPIGLLVMLFVIFLPIALIWVAALTLRTVRSLRDEARRLHAAVEAMRHAYVQQQQTGAVKPSVEKRIEEIAAAQKQTESAMAMFVSRRDLRPAPVPPPAPAPLPPGEDQPALALGTRTEDQRPPLPVADFIRALNFPDSGEDAEGFRALRSALEDRDVSRLIRAAQDVLTLLSQDGIYMDDLRPDRARPEVWRRFARGERGQTVGALGGIRDRSCLALTAGRMRQDPVFRDAAHHFLRQFDRSFSIFEVEASDQDISDLAETRTARAFMLFGRVAGVFD